MPPTAHQFGPLDEVLGTLLETWGQRYRFEFNRQERLILFSKPPDNEVGAKEMADGRIHIVYQPSADATAEEFCSPAQAAALIDALMSRSSLVPVALPHTAQAVPATATAPAKRGFFGRLFRR
jgi:hypothetical protein